MLARALNLFFPPQCIQCRSIVAENGTLCAECWQSLTFIAEPCCPRCGTPFEFALGAAAHSEEHALCADCIRTPPVFSRARAVLRYDAASRALVLKLKFHDDTALAATYGPWLARAGGDLLIGVDAIVPVPLHYWRYVGRRYNQAALLAGALARAGGIPLLNALARTRATAPQSGLRKKKRAENVAGAFAVPEAMRERIRGKTVLLVDDVYTTGATLNACAAALFDARARDVRVVTLARRASRR